MGKKKHHQHHQHQRAPPCTEAAVDALAEMLGGAFPPGAIRGVLAQCGGDAERALDVLLATAPPVATACSQRRSDKDEEEEEEEERKDLIAESGSSRDEEEEGSESESDNDTSISSDSSGRREGKMVTVAAASKAAVAGYMGAVKAAEAGRALSAAAENEKEERPPPQYLSSAWELLKTMFEGLLPQAALDAAYAAHHHRKGVEGGEGGDDLAAMVEEAARMLANEQAEVDDEEEDEEEAPSPLTLLPPPSTTDQDEEGEEEEEERIEDEGLAALRALFPSLPLPFLQATLERFAGNVDSAAYDLLGGSPPSSSSTTTTTMNGSTHRSPPRPPRRARPMPLKHALNNLTALPTTPTAAASASASASPWAPVNPAPSTFALSPPSSSSTTAALLRSDSSTSSAAPPLFAPSVKSTEAFPHLPSSPSPYTSNPAAAAPRYSRLTSGGSMAAASRALKWLEEVYGAEFEREMIRFLATEVHNGDAAAVESSLAEMDPRAFARCRKARQTRAAEAALLRNLSISSSSTSMPTNTNDTTTPDSTIIRPTPMPYPSDPRAAAAACRKQAEAERMAMVEGFRRAAAVFGGGGGGGVNGRMLGSSAAALAAEHSYAHRRAMQCADAEAAACLLQAQSTPSLAVAVVEGSTPGIAVVGARADVDGGLRVDLHGLKVKEAAQAIQSLVPHLGPARVKTLRIITGRGTHSRQGKARLGPAVLKALAPFPHLRATPDSPGGAVIVRVLRGQR